MQTELTNTGLLLDGHGRLAQIGWSRQPLLDSSPGASPMMRGGWI